MAAPILIIDEHRPPLTEEMSEEIFDDGPRRVIVEVDLKSYCNSETYSREHGTLDLHFLLHDAAFDHGEPTDSDHELLGVSPDAIDGDKAVVLYSTG